MVLESVPKLLLAERKSQPCSEAQVLALLAEREKRRVVSVALAARLVGRSRDTIYRWLEEGKLSGRKVGGRWIVYQDSIEAEWEAGLVEREDSLIERG